MMFEEGDLVTVYLSFPGFECPCKGMIVGKGWLDQRYSSPVQYWRVLVEWNEQTLDYEAPFFKIKK